MGSFSTRDRGDTFAQPSGMARPQVWLIFSIISSMSHCIPSTVGNLPCKERNRCLYQRVEIITCVSGDYLSRWNDVAQTVQLVYAKNHRNALFSIFLFH